MLEASLQFEENGVSHGCCGIIPIRQQETIFLRVKGNSNKYICPWIELKLWISSPVAKQIRKSKIIKIMIQRKHHTSDDCIAFDHQA
jgi:hypothetical protein